MKTNEIESKSSNNVVEVLVNDNAILKTTFEGKFENILLARCKRSSGFDPETSMTQSVNIFDIEFETTKLTVEKLYPNYIYNDFRTLRTFLLKFYLKEIKDWKR